eukprot:TRINITY_DN4528_c0_g1_i3.p1 TRINITY_DN4528_c0_g1~~TRINITY_DN4528_c0_g1_i3.p1  ORF type:complete len:440 (+),score=73.78 TRINITY_DN4528_c0_g1_i3:91-1410(+)
MRPLCTPKAAAAACATAAAVAVLCYTDISGSRRGGEAPTSEPTRSPTSAPTEAVATVVARAVAAAVASALGPRFDRMDSQLAELQQSVPRLGGPAPAVSIPVFPVPHCKGSDSAIELWPQPATAAASVIAAIPPPQEMYAGCQILRPTEVLQPRPDPPCRGSCATPGAAADPKRCGCKAPPGTRHMRTAGGWWVWGSQSREDAALYHRYFCGRCGGTFVEMGALDGLRYSNTLFFERALGWRGVLIEALPDNVAQLRRNRPLSTIVGKAACPDRNGTIQFVRGVSSAVGGAADLASPSFRDRWWARGWENRTITVPCSPLGTLLREAGLRKVDLFVLDVEGGELATLNTMDWSIPVRVWVIELDNHNETKNTAVRLLLLSHGYRQATAVGWRIGHYCKPKTPLLQEPCMANEVFEHPGLVAAPGGAAAVSAAASLSSSP